MSCVLIDQIFFSSKLYASSFFNPRDHRRHVIQEGSDQKPTKVWRKQNDNLAASRSSLAQFQKN